MREFDAELLKLITVFENITGTEVRDCINSDTLYFLVNPGKLGIAIGKKGKSIKKAEMTLKKPIKIMEWAEDEKQFIKNMIPQVQNIKITSNKAVISLNPKDKGIVIGKNGSKINIIKQFLERNSKLKDLKIL
ncbi:MAG: NusA-like transcription termination signal-binding factor [Candidatus Aenigmarchaeota archaeon]|nr:NusA-like transcription termination signal-binding factor [Candidatus Aenigmarchaeota archaeon]